MAQQKTKFVIHPFKHNQQMDEDYANRTWQTLHDAIREIHRQNASGLSFEELYRNAYNMVLHKFGDKLYNGLTDTITQHLQGVAALVQAANDDTFLQELKDRWDKHKLSSIVRSCPHARRVMDSGLHTRCLAARVRRLTLTSPPTQMIRDILMYMDRTYVSSQKKTPVYERGLQIFRDEVCRHAKIKDRLLQMLLELIQRERQGEMIERGLLKTVTSMLVELGRDVYQRDFETPFLQASSTFYAAESQEYISQNSAADYMKKAEQRLHEELDRVAHYLDPSSEGKIKEVAERELIAKHMRTLAEMEHSGVIAMIEDNKIDDLRRAYDLFKRVTVPTSGLKVLRRAPSPSSPSHTRPRPSLDVARNFTLTVTLMLTLTLVLALRSSATSWPGTSSRAVPSWCRTRSATRTRCCTCRGCSRCAISTSG